jgi:hypothetical protein
MFSSIVKRKRILKPSYAKLLFTSYTLTIPTDPTPSNPPTPVYTYIKDGALNMSIASVITSNLTSNRWVGNGIGVTISASSQRYSYTPPYASFTTASINKNPSSWKPNANTGWLKATFDEPICLNKFAFAPATNQRDDMPKQFTFEASNDGTNWIVLGSWSGLVENSWSNTGYTYKSVQNDQEYSQYRFNITKLVGTTSTGSTCQALQLRHIKLIKAGTEVVYTPAP